MQALVLLNDPEFVEAAEKIGACASKADDPIQYTFRLLTSRRPNDREAAVLKHLYDEQLALTSDKHLAATALASAVLNFDDAVMKR